MICLSNFPALQAAIAVPYAKAADFLRNGVEFPGVIINSQAWDYPSMDHMHPTYISYFRKYEMENHMPYVEQCVQKPCIPTWIHRADNRKGYLK